jgi:hypothetical protein
MLLLSNGTLDDLGMKSIWDQTDDQIMLANLRIECLLVGYIERDGSCELDALGELLRRFEGSAS